MAMSQSSDKETKWRKTRLLLFAAAVGLTAQTALSQQAAADPDAAILDRQLVMQQLDKDSEELGEILAGIKKPDRMVAVTASIAKSAKEAQASFQIKAEGGGAKPEVWSNHADFMKRMDAWVAAADKMAKVAAEGGTVPTINELVVEALPCKACHDVYRVPET
jgi:adenylosuccinate lyase